MICSIGHLRVADSLSSIYIRRPDSVGVLAASDYPLFHLGQLHIRKHLYCANKVFGTPFAQLFPTMRNLTITITFIDCRNPDGKHQKTINAETTSGQATNGTRDERGPCPVCAKQQKPAK